MLKIFPASGVQIIDKKIFPEIIFLPVLLFLLHFFVSDMADDTPQCLVKFLRIHRFEHIIHHAIAQRFLCIGKIIISTKDDDLQIRAGFPHLLRQFQPAHIGHLHIRKQDIHMCF